MPRYYFFLRGGKNPGWTVSKGRVLPTGDFGLTEYKWNHLCWISLWFIDSDEFTAAERQAAFDQFVAEKFP